MEDDQNCPGCKRSTVVVLDRSSGDIICSECGLVLESHYIDETAEWRTYADDFSNYDCVNMIRVGAPSNPFLDDGGLSTVISKQNGASGDSFIRGFKNRCLNTDQSGLSQALTTICAMSDRLGLVTTIKDRANEIYKNVVACQKSRVGKNEDAYFAACLYTSCLEEDRPRTIKEIRCTANGASKKEIGRAIKYIMSKLVVNIGQSMERGIIHARDFVRRFCPHLGMPNQDFNAAQEALAALQRLEELDIRRRPSSVAAAVICMITQLSDEKKQLQDVSNVTGVSICTIKKSYKDIYPYAVRLVPAWYANEEDLNSLYRP
ncbi:hypothetical protein MKW94_011674 [Papaver nudicaule]|uniref:TFIIB-type domain-containing protein n=1 Tax=Papaver nudicaule TaxID=74823 RepID=A0AA41V920_PAPNU|nr:hypothetical protein [Papaver nudicaule]MCL7041449.1 hypothetical protein [Papaver nudicaule]